MLKCENLPRTNSTKYETQNILVKFQQNEHTPGLLNKRWQACALLNVDKYHKMHIFMHTVNILNSFSLFVSGLRSICNPSDI